MSKAKQTSLGYVSLIVCNTLALAPLMTALAPTSIVIALVSLIIAVGIGLVFAKAPGLLWQARYVYGACLLAAIVAISFVNAYTLFGLLLHLAIAFAFFLIGLALIRSGAKNENDGTA